MQCLIPPRLGNLHGQVAGYAVEYEGLTFATVKGAGHMVSHALIASLDYVLRLFCTFFLSPLP